MFRSLLVYLSQASWAKRLITNSALAKRTASRFVAGETLENALAAVHSLNDAGINATLDHLGEHTSDEFKAKKATEDILTIIEQINNKGARANVSIKLTQIGLALNQTLCETNLKEILELAAESGILVRIDMEDSPWIDHTLDLYWKMRNEYLLHNVGVVIQSYLYRSESDVIEIISAGGRIRLCKGAYKEPSSIAYPNKIEVDSNFDKITKFFDDFVV